MPDVPLLISLPAPPMVVEDSAVQRYINDLGWSLGDMYTALAVAINGIDINIDGGDASEEYLTDQLIDGGGA